MNFILLIGLILSIMVMCYGVFGLITLSSFYKNLILKIKMAQVKDGLKKNVRNYEVFEDSILPHFKEIIIRSNFKFNVHKFFLSEGFKYSLSESKKLVAREDINFYSVTLLIQCFSFPWSLYLDEWYSGSNNFINKINTKDFKILDTLHTALFILSMIPLRGLKNIKIMELLYAVNEECKDAQFLFPSQVDGCDQSLTTSEYSSVIVLSNLEFLEIQNIKNKKDPLLELNDPILNAFKPFIGIKCMTLYPRITELDQGYAIYSDRYRPLRPGQYKKMILADAYWKPFIQKNGLIDTYAVKEFRNNKNVKKSFN